MATEFLMPWAQIEPAEVARLPEVVRFTFRRESVAWVRAAYDRQLAQGIGANGQRLAPIHALTKKARADDVNPVSGKSPYSPMGRAGAANPPLMATGARSRTRTLMRAEETEQGIRIWWTYDPYTGHNWGDILEHHAAGFARHFVYPRHGWGYVKARDVFGLAPGTLSAIRLEGQRWLRTGYRALLTRQPTFEPAAATVDLGRAAFGIGASKKTVKAAEKAGTFTGFRQSVFAAPLGPKPPKPPKAKPKPKPEPTAPLSGAALIEAGEAFAARYGIAIERNGQATIKQSKEMPLTGGWPERPEDQPIAMYLHSEGQKVYLNEAHPFWQPGLGSRLALQWGRSRWFATDDPQGIIHHEIGHALHWRRTPTNIHSAIAADVFTADQETTAREVSEYAATQPTEFVAEVFAGLASGKRYSDAVMQLYHYFHGPTLEVLP